MKSLRMFLIVVILSVVCLSNFIAALQGYRTSLAAGDGLVDKQIIEKTHSLGRLLDSTVSLPGNLYDEHSLYQVWQKQQLLVKSDNAPIQAFVNAAEGLHTISYQGRRWRTYVYQADKAHQLIVVAQRYDLYSAITESILLEAIAPIIWVLPLVGLLIWLIVYGGLKPLQQLANKLSGKGVDDFSTIDGSRYPQELRPIVSSLNHLLTRLDEAFEREKRFSADAAHELRTPLAALKVALHNLSTEQVDSASVISLNKMVERMGHTIEQLLAMHSVSAKQGAESFEPCDLYTISQNVIAQMYHQVEKKSQTIELIGSAAVVMGEPYFLSAMLRNLIDNASKYTPEGGSIHVTVSQASDEVSLLIEDSGPGIAEQEHQRVTERFYRVGGDQHNSGVQGSGLGLSIVSFVANLHHGGLRFTRSKKLGGLAVEVLLPKLYKR